jgi:aspartyl-tRNA(Asn)/glutamyl-tRNA(Gln) amidotransferase subunit B
MRENGLSAYDAGVLVADQEKAAYYEVVAKGRDGKLAANWVITNLFGALNKLEVPVTESPVTAENLGKLLDLISDDTISGRIAKDVFEIMIETGNDPEKIVEEKGLKQITDTGAIETAIDEVIAANPDKVQEIRDGKDRMLGWFVGQVMKSTGGKANPGMVNQMLRDKILG